MHHHIILWKWRPRVLTSKYEPTYVNAMARQVARQCSLPHSVICITDDPAGITDCRTFPLWEDLSQLRNMSGQHLPSCYRRLKIFDRPTQESIGIARGDRVVSLDLDAILTNTVDSLWVRPERFVGWHVPGTRHATVYNGSMFMFTAGDLQEVWSDFNPTKSPTKALIAGYMGSDQAYLSYKLVNQPYAGGWTAERDGVLSFTRNIERARLKRYPKLSVDQSRIVFFAGRRKPWHKDVLEENPWIHKFVGTA